MADQTPLKRSGDGAPPENAAPPTPFDAYLKLADGGRPGFWRVPIGLSGIFLASLVMAVLILAALSTSGPDATEGPLRGAALLATIGLTVPPILAIVVRLHGREPWSLISPHGLDGPLALRAGLLSAALAIGATLVSAPLSGAEIIWRSEPAALGYGAILLALAILLWTPLQCLAEELVFRGYLLQELGRRIRHPIAWAVVPAILFALLHGGGGRLSPTEDLALMTSAAVFGLFAAALVWRFGDLSPAIGAHLGFNLVALLLIEGPYGLDGPALFALTPDPTTPIASMVWNAVIADMFLLAAAYGALSRLAPARP